MNEDTEVEPIIYDERTPFYKTGLSPEVMPSTLSSILWANQFTDLATLYVILSNYPDTLAALCDVLQVDFDDLKQAVTDRLSGDFLRKANASREDHTFLLNPLMERLDRYVQYCDLLLIPGVIYFEEYQHFTKGLSLKVIVSMSKSDPTTALLLQPIHQKTGITIDLIHEH